MGVGGPISGLQGWGSLRATAPLPHPHPPSWLVWYVCLLCPAGFASLNLWPRGSLLPFPVQCPLAKTVGNGVSKLSSHPASQNPVLVLEGINPGRGRPGPQLTPGPVAWWQDMPLGPWDLMWISESQAHAVMAGSLGSLTAASRASTRRRLPLDPWCTHIPGAPRVLLSACISWPAHLPPPASVSLQCPWPSPLSTQGGRQAVPLPLVLAFLGP